MTDDDKVRVAATLQTMTVVDIWRGFELMVVPHNAGDVQRREMRMAFMAGFSSALGSLRVLADTHGPREPEACSVIDRWWNECEQYVRDLPGGRH